MNFSSNSSSFVNSTSGKVEGGGDDGGDILVVVVGENGIFLLISATYSSSFVNCSSNSPSFVNSSSGKMEGEGGDESGQQVVEVQVRTMGSEESEVVDTLKCWILAEVVMNTFGSLMRELVSGEEGNGVVAVGE